MGLKENILKSIFIQEEKGNILNYFFQDHASNSDF